MNKLGKRLLKLDCSSVVELAMRESKRIVIKDQVLNATSLQEHRVLPQVKVQGPHQASRMICQNHQVQRNTFLVTLRFLNLPSQGKKPVAKHQLNIPYLRVQVQRILLRIVHQDPAERCQCW